MIYTIDKCTFIYNTLHNTYNCTTITIVFVHLYNTLHPTTINAFYILLNTHAYELIHHNFIFSSNIYGLYHHIWQQMRQHQIFSCNLRNSCIWFFQTLVSLAILDHECHILTTYNLHRIFNISYFKIIIILKNIRLHE